MSTGPTTMQQIGELLQQVNLAPIVVGFFVNFALGLVRLFLDRKNRGRNSQGRYE
jgi:hypothetical protein